MANRLGCVSFLYLFNLVACEPALVADDSSTVRLDEVADDLVVAKGLRVEPEADAEVREGSDERDGSAHQIAVDLDDEEGAVLRGYMRFRLAELPPVRRATLRLYITNGSASSARIFRVSGSSWDEKSLHWRNKPEVDGPQIAELGETTAGAWVSIDVSSEVSDGGVLSLAFLARSEDGFAFASHDAPSGRPYIVIEPETPSLAAGGLSAGKSSIP